ncbi:hypothetical protein L202_03321 [Cryptococcus amylolentus CBS 6039]|uniref:Chromatin modification-related protein EAF7 n=1 Tax=Cryptococcus amylolentus CBS 6039 TaxID=1295533 RepID=A0A1E3HSH0_9TREE|nr:hypothetical protein L202_03321 [Cryptococcus amylolentus CBS 6039]ODN79313.1 hypothetical protein L202_03321 [Cryptococcus amylolentus CBS 6039]
MTSEPAMAHQHAPTELEIEIALLGCLGEARPLGRHKHFLIIRLQGAIHRRLGIWLTVDSLWERLDELYDLESLDELASEASNSQPPSPISLSPRDPSPTRFSSNSPLSDISSPSHPAPQGKNRKVPISKSARVLNSRHFKHVFDLPYFRIKQRHESEEGTTDEEEEEKDGEADGKEDDSEEESDDGVFEFELDGQDEMAWEGIIYPRAIALDGTDEPWGGVFSDENVSSPSEDGEENAGRNGVSRSRTMGPTKRRRGSTVSIAERKKRKNRDSLAIEGRRGGGGGGTREAVERTGQDSGKGKI